MCCAWRANVTSRTDKCFGFYLEAPIHKAFLVYIHYKNPNLLRFRFAEATCNDEKLKAIGGKIVDGKRFFEFNLSGQIPDFFTLPADDQMTAITGFIKSSFENAEECVN